jgi:hypothetical protein
VECFNADSQTGDNSLPSRDNNKSANLTGDIISEPDCGDMGISGVSPLNLWPMGSVHNTWKTLPTFQNHIEFFRSTALYPASS